MMFRGMARLTIAASLGQAALAARRQSEAYLRSAVIVCKS
jgi:hypothetical protein